MTDKYQYCLVLRKAPQVTLTINPTPSDAIVKINGTVQNSITVLAGDSVDWEVSKVGYCTKKGTAIIQRTSTASIILSDACVVSVSTQQDGVTIAISDTVNSTSVSGRNATLATVAGRTVTVTMTKTGYTTYTQTFTNITGGISIIRNLTAAVS